MKQFILIFILLVFVLMGLSLLVGGEMKPITTPAIIN